MSLIVVVISSRFPCRYSQISVKRRAWAHEDLDRLRKTWAMYTFAEISTLEFSPTLRMACQRTAVMEDDAACCCCQMGKGII